MAPGPRPVMTMLLGMAIVALDFRIGGFDLLTDVLGWIILAVGLGSLAPASPWFGSARVAAWLGAFVGVPETFTDDSAGPVWLASVLLQTGVLFSTCTGLMGALPDRPDLVTRFDVIRWVDLAATTVLLLVFATDFVADSGPAPAGALVAGPVALIGIFAVVAMAIWFAISAFGVRDHPALSGA